MPRLFFDLDKGDLYDVAEKEHRSMILNTPAIASLGSLLVADTFEIKFGDYGRLSPGQVTSESMLKLGHSVVDDLSEYDPIPNLNVAIADRLYALGVWPQREYFRKNPDFGSFREFKRQLGLHTPFVNRGDGAVNEAYRNTTPMALASTLLHHYNRHLDITSSKPYEGPLTQVITDFLHIMGEGPSDDVLEAHGGIRGLNEVLGYPNIFEWAQEDYISYGAHVIKYNGPDSLTTSVIENLADQSLGPRRATISTNIGWEKFVLLSTREYQNTIHQQQIVTDHFEKLGIGDNKEVPYEIMARGYGCFMLGQLTDVPFNWTRRTTPNPQNVDKFLGRIIEKKHWSGYQLEELIMLNGLDVYIWPVTEPRILPIVRQVDNPHQYRKWVNEYYQRYAPQERPSNISFNEKAAFRALGILGNSYLPGKGYAHQLPARITQQTVHDVLSSIRDTCNVTNAEIIATAKERGVLSAIEHELLADS